ncbi:hypothetical protein BDV93DRAFT_560565 [Ceratobasidium sp. AG-I]|nr:hypothetical protein BDV93DRAFT_560565 [Ceratobasidium sp. AG-I]
MVQNHGAVTKARVQMALAQATYIFGFADTECAKLYQRFAAVELSYCRDARQAANKPSTNPIMNNYLPRVNTPNILAQLQQGLLSLNELGLPPPGMPSTLEIPHVPHLGPEGATADEPVEVIPLLEHFWVVLHTPRLTSC